MVFFTGVDKIIKFHIYVIFLLEKSKLIIAQQKDRREEKLHIIIFDNHCKKFRWGGEVDIKK